MLWIFAYGSLIWRPGFGFSIRQPATIFDYERRLDQGSPDHRGTPEKLGRVATLLHRPGAQCGGLLYGIDKKHAEPILQMLDHREQGGYERVWVSAQLHGEEPRVIGAITWIASPENPYHLGRAPIDEMIRQIESATGPSGSNIEYVLKLSEALDEHGIEDEHIQSIAARLKQRRDEF